MSEELPRSYPVPTASLPGVAMSDHLEDMEELRELLESRGITTRNTRIVRYIDFLAKVNGIQDFDELGVFKNSTDGPFQHHSDWFLYVLREVHELMWILKGLKKQIPKGADEKLREIVSGSDFAALDTNSQSRDTQFELRIASYFCQSECEIDLSSRTDVVAYTDKIAFYIECKRVTNAKKLRRRLSEAKRQLAEGLRKKEGNRVLFGAVAADVTKVAFTHNGLTFAHTSDHSRDIIRGKLLNVAGSLDSMNLFSRCRKLYQYWLQIHIPSLVMTPPTPTTRFSSYMIGREKLNGKERKATRDFRSIFERASESVDDRTIPSAPLTIRRSLKLPKGTTGNIDPKVLEDYLRDGTLPDPSVNSIIAEITISGNHHEFVVYDFIMLASRIPQKRRLEYAKNPDRALIDLTAELYLQRFPYEETAEPTNN